ncbi:MAG: MotA/TolQ/ExbB proton channel family protein [Marinilabiliales bacterium]|nr:MotA/TolQ/ExbB proton channel family protein [Marinilabiliales bacterium]
MDQQKNAFSFRDNFAAWVIPVAFLVAVFLYFFVMGASSNFQGNDSDNLPLQGNFLGLIYKGGYIVPLLMTLLLVAITFSIERYLTIKKAYGNLAPVKFVARLKEFLAREDIQGARAECDRVQGSVAMVAKSTLDKYEQVVKDTQMSKEQKVLDIQKNVEEAISLELPGLEENLPALATITSLATLMGLLGTVLGMIRSFAAMANAGAPDSVALANGISEALVNTAFGIASAAIAMVSYSYFTTRIDKLTYAIDEAGYSIAQTFAARY